MNNFTGSFEFWKSFLNSKIVLSWGWVVMYIGILGLVGINSFEFFSNRKSEKLEEPIKQVTTEENKEEENI